MNGKWHMRHFVPRQGTADYEEVPEDVVVEYVLTLLSLGWVIDPSHYRMIGRQYLNFIQPINLWSGPRERYVFRGPSYITEW